jgi:hypothetical protein
LDLEAHRLQKRYHAGHGLRSSWAPLPTGMRLGEVRLPGEAPSRRIVEIPFLPTGASATYGCRLDGPGRRKAWLIVAGASGQFTSYNEESLWNATLQLVQREGRLDAD